MSMWEFAAGRFMARRLRSVRRTHQHGGDMNARLRRIAGAFAAQPVDSQSDEDPERPIGRGAPGCGGRNSGDDRAALKNARSGDAPQLHEPLPLREQVLVEAVL